MWEQTWKGMKSIGKGMTNIGKYNKMHENMWKVVKHIWTCRKMHENAENVGKAMKLVRNWMTRYAKCAKVCDVGKSGYEKVWKL